MFVENHETHGELIKLTHGTFDLLQYITERFTELEDENGEMIFPISNELIGDPLNMEELFNELSNSGIKGEMVKNIENAEIDDLANAGLTGWQLGLKLDLIDDCWNYIFHEFRSIRETQANGFENNDSAMIRGGKSKLKALLKHLSTVVGSLLEILGLKSALQEILDTLTNLLERLIDGGLIGDGGIDIRVPEDRE